MSPNLNAMVFNGHGRYSRCKGHPALTMSETIILWWRFSYAIAVGIIEGIISPACQKLPLLCNIVAPHCFSTTKEKKIQT